MKYDELLTKIQYLPVIESELLLAGNPNPAGIKVQLSRWAKTGKLIQVKRGIYVLANNYRKVESFELYLASVLKKPSYLSLEKALEYHGLIPEAVPVYTSVTTKMGAQFTSKVGRFTYRHIKPALLWGYETVPVGNQSAYVATPEKALLDLIYLRGVNITEAFLAEMRLQNLENINRARLAEFARQFKKPGIIRAAGLLERYIASQPEMKTL